MAKLRIKKALSVFLSVLMVLSCWVWVAPHDHTHAEAAEVTKDHYLFAYFTGNSSDGQTVHFAVSEDGLHYTALRNNEPVIIPSKGTGAVRDPYIWYNEQDNYYYLICTDMDAADNQWWDNCNGFIMWRSKDLVHWYDETFINVYDMLQKFNQPVGIVHRAWAPQIMWDGQSYIVYFSIDTDNVSYPADQLSIVYLKTTDLLNLDAYYEYGGILYPGYDVNDADIVQNPKTGKWYLFYKPENGNIKINMMVSDNATGPYTSADPNNSAGLDVFASVSEALEGGNGFFNNNGDFILYADAYGHSTPYFYVAKTSDFTSWTVYDESAHNINSLSPRHGSVVRITAEAYNTLLNNAYGITASSFPSTEELSDHLVGRYFTTSDVTYNAANGKNDLDEVSNVAMYNDYLPEQIGYHAYFNGGYAKIDIAKLFPNGIDYDDGFTITFTASVSGSNDSRFYSITDGTNSTNFAVNGSASGAYVYNNSKAHTTSTNLADSALHEYVISYANGNIIIYKDGELFLKKNRFNDGVMTEDWYTAISNGTLYIGALDAGGGKVIGRISDFCIYDCSLSYYDVKNIQNEQDIESGLVKIPVDNSSYGTVIPSWTHSTTSQMSSLAGTYFSNILYSPTVTGMPSGATKDSNPTSGNGAAVAGSYSNVYYGIYYANNTVLYVDGKTTPKMPVYLAGRINSDEVYAANLQKAYPIISTSNTGANSQFALTNYWRGWNSSSVYHDTVGNPDGAALGYSPSVAGTAFDLQTGDSQNI